MSVYQTDMRIIPMTPDLIPALSDLAIATFCETFAHLYPPEDLETFLTTSYALEKLAAEVLDTTQFWRIVFDDLNRAVAYLHLGPVGLPHPDANPQTDGELKRLYIRECQQGKGLGKNLMTLALEQLTTTYGSAPQWIGVWSQNIKAQNLYGSYGFTRVGEYQFPVGNTLDDEFILRRIPA